jgi:FimV-like protein
MRKRLAFVLAIVSCVLWVVASSARVSAKDMWMRVHSKNFVLVGNASEKDLRQVAVRLEQFREVFSRLFPTFNVNSPVPTTVVVFKNSDSYRPFKPNANAAGYFQAGSDVNYITLELVKEFDSERDPFTIIFHEYTHLLVRNTSGNVPTWFNEGLAEYYSTFSITGDQKVIMGRPIASHVKLLRQNLMLPLRTLFQVDQKSPYYNERYKQSIFYAESWALLHYLILGKAGQRIAQLNKFVELISASVPMEQAFQQAFAMTFESMEDELRTYVERDRYPTISRSFTSKVGYDREMLSEPITEAEAQAYLGDLMLKSNRGEAEVYLQRALALDPDLAMANASLGLLRLRQDKPDEARRCLERALTSDPQNYLIHYYYAYLLSREGDRDMDRVLGFPPDTALRMRAELKRAIQLRPDFLESYGLLALVNLVTDTELDEAIELLKRTLAVSPGRNDLVFMLAQLYMREEDFKTARQLIDKLIGNSDPELRQRARELLTRLNAFEEQLATIRAAEAGQPSSSRRATKLQISRDANGQAVILMEVDPAAMLREALRKPAAGETQAQGTLMRIDCDGKSISFIVKANDRLFKLNTATFDEMNIKSFSTDAGRQLTCGPRQPENNVVVGYLPATDARAPSDGIIRSIEFVPPDFKLTP